MEAQISTSESEIEDVYARRWRYYPTRSDNIMSMQDRQDWITVARDIMTHWGQHPENIAKIAPSSSLRVEKIKLFKAKKPQRSLWNILIGIFNSAHSTKTIMPTVPEMDALFEELNPPKPSPALERYKAQHPDSSKIKQGIIPKKHLLDAPVIPHTSRRTRWVLAESDQRDTSVAIYYPHLSPKCQEVFRLFYGYVWIGDPADPASYHGNRRSIPMIATELRLSYQTVYVRFQKISQIIEWLRGQEEESSETNEDVQAVISTSQEKVETVLKTSTRNNLSILPDVTHVHELSPTQKADFLAFYGYRWESCDPTNPESYDATLCQTRDEIAAKRDANRLAVQMSIYTAYRKLQELSQANKPKDVPVEKPAIKPEIQTPSFLKNRRIVTPIPKRQSDVVPQYMGETRTTQAIPSRVVRPPQPVPTKFVPTTTLAPQKRIWVIPKQTRQKPSAAEFSFEELVAHSSEVRTVPQKPEVKPQPLVKKQLREIPEFTSYREALEWGQKQADWIWGITLWKNSTPPFKRDDMWAIPLLQSQNYSGLQSFLDKVREVSWGARLKYIKIFEVLLAPLPEEKPTITDIQKNEWWMTLITSAFQKHESGDYAGFMDSLATILADEVLAAKVFDLMPEYEAEDYVDILALVVGKNWMKKDTLPYQTHTLKEMIWYKPGKYVRLDAILEKWSHVGKKMLIEGLSDIRFKAPIGKTMWSRFQEKDAPEVSLYDIVASLVKAEERESSKALFHTLEDILWLKK